MSTSTRDRRATRRNARVFAALGDETRLSLLARLGEGEALSITRLTEGQPLTRQSITKHLRVLRHAGLVRSVRRGRETCFALDAKRIEDARTSLARIAAQWDEALERLKAHIERE